MHFNTNNLLKRLRKEKNFKVTLLYFLILVDHTKYILKDPMDDFMSLKI
jgi:hypothetical protein